MVAFASACAVSQKKTLPPSQVPGPLLTANKEELIERYNHLAGAIHSLDAGVALKLTAGSAEGGVIEQYHEVGGFILAARPRDIRVIGQAPVVGKNIFDMVSDGQTFRIFIPSKNKFLVGSVHLERQAKKPIENLRPQHILEAMFWTPIPPDAPVLIDEWMDPESQSYVLTVVHPIVAGKATTGERARATDWEITSRIWFSRTALEVQRIELFSAGGRLISDTSYGNWQPAGEAAFPRWLEIRRPHDGLILNVTIKKLAVNEPIAADRFTLEQPPGTELVRVVDEAETKESQP